MVEVEYVKWQANRSLFLQNRRTLLRGEGGRNATVGLRYVCADELAYVWKSVVNLGMVDSAESVDRCNIVKDKS